MLIVHPSSVCDVCLEPYGWEEQARTPHAIPCGHIFCYSCLQLTTPSNCPLCRKAFLPQRIKKIHVDRFNGAIDDSSSPVFKLLMKIAMANHESATSDDMNAVAYEAQVWLADQKGQSPRPHVLEQQMAVRHAVEGLHKVRVVQERAMNQTTRLEDKIKRYETENNRLQQDLLHAKVVEQALVAQENNRRDELNMKLERAERKLRDMKEEMARLTEENNYFRERYLHTSNPLPPPPQLVPMDHLDSMMNDASGPGRTQTLSPIPESQEDPRAHRLRRPVMRPGAPPPMKVIPPHLQNPAQIWKYANPKPTSAPNPPELEQLEVLNIRAGPSSTSELRSDDARHATHGPSVSSESLERVQTRAAYPSNYRPEHTDGYGHDVHGLELEGILPNDSQPSASRHMSLTQHNTGEEQHEASALAFDPGLNRGYQITPRPGTSGLPEPSNEQAYVGERGQMEADPELGVQLAVFALPLERDGSPSTTPRSPFRQLMAGNASASSSLSDLPLGITGPGLSSSSRSQHSTVAQAPSSGPTMAAQQMYSVPSAASSSNSWGTVHHSRQSSFASLHLARFPEPAEDSQPPSANPSVHDLGRLPIFPNTQPAAASTSNRDESPPAPMESSQSSSQAEHPPHNVASAGGARDSRQERSRVSLPLDDRAPSNAYPRGPRPSGAFRTTSSLNLGLTSLTGNLQSSLPQLLNGQGSFSSLSSLVSVNESVGFGGNFGRSGSPAEERRTSVPTRAQTARPESARLQPASSSLEDVRTSRRTGSDQGYVSEATSKSSSQPSLPSSSQAERPRQARHISMPATPANYDPHSGVGRRSGVPLYASPNHSTSHTAIGSNSNHTSSSSSQDRLQTSTDSRNPGTSSQTPPEEPLAREQPRQRRHSTRNVSTPAVFSRAQSSSQTPHPGSSSSSLIRSHTVSVTPQALPRSSTTSLGNTSYLAPLGGGLMLTMEPPSTSSAATADGQPDSSIHAPRPVNNRRSGLFGLLGPRSAR